MSHHSGMHNYVKTVDEAVTYLEDPNEEVEYLDLGSAEVRIVRNAQGQETMIITTSSGHAACFPAEVFSSLR